MKTLYFLIFVAVYSLPVRAGDKPVESADKKFSLQVFEDAPATAPPKENIKMNEPFIAFFTVDLCKSGKHIENFSKAEEIEYVEYTLSMQLDSKNPAYANVKLNGVLSCDNMPLENKSNPNKPLEVIYSRRYTPKGKRSSLKSLKNAEYGFRVSFRQH